MVNKAHMEKLKLAGGVIIVATAGLIMLPGFTYELTRFANVVLLVGIALVFALLFTVLKFKIFTVKEPQTTDTGVAERTEAQPGNN